jgi:hypothetical protein
MKEEKIITIFICEDRETTEQIMKDYFSKDKISYANSLLAKKRTEVVKAIDKVDEIF